MTDRREKRLERLVRKAAQGDARAFGELYDEYVDRVYSFVRARVSSSHDAEDLTETVFLKAYEAIGRYDDRGLPFSAWLFRIARNVTIDWHRRSGRAPTFVGEDAAERLPARDRPEEIVLGNLDAERVRAGIRRLTEEQADVIVLRFFWGMSQREIGETIGKTEGSVKALQHRAVRSLERILTEETSDE